MVTFMSLVLFPFQPYNRVIARKIVRKEELTILKGRLNYLPELSLLIASIAYNVIRIMNDFGSINAPSCFLEMDIPGVSLLLLILLIILKSDARE